MSGKSILLVARQAGTANAFTPLIHELGQRGWLVHQAALGQARPLWGGRSGVLAGESFAELEPALERIHPRVLLTGTSLDVVDDGRFWTWARKRQIPSVGFVDSWVNYSERFTASSRFDTLPEIVAVVDDLARRRLEDAGCPSPIVIVGTPLFDELSEMSLELHDTARALLVVTEPLLAEYGFTASDLVHHVLDARRIIGLDHEVVIKPHPREDQATYQSLCRSGRGVRVVEPGLGRVELFTASRAVIGVHSIMLVEAILAGLPALSVQPDGALRNDVVNEERGIRVVTSFSRLTEEIAKLVCEPLRPCAVERSAPLLADQLEFML